MDRFDLIVIGGGPGGLVVTAGASQLGVKVALIEAEQNLGGDCLHYGCVPSKTFIKSAKVFHQIKNAEKFGIDPVNPTFDIRNVMKRIRSVIDTIQVIDHPDRFEKMGATVIFGKASFVSPHEVAVNGKTLWGKQIVIATGSRPVVPPIPGLKEFGFITNHHIFRIENFPKSLIFIGGGPIAVEMSQVFCRFGCRVTLIEREEHILPLGDRDVSVAHQEILIQEGVDVHAGVHVTEVRKEGNEKIVIGFEGNTQKEFRGEEIVLAVGQVANVEGLNLDKIGVQYDRKGITIDSKCRTSVKHIWACGDVAGPYQFTHLAEYQAGVIISNAVFGFPKKMDLRVFPWVVYTDPEYAHVGLNEKGAREKGLSYEICHWEFKENDRAQCDGETEGFVKLMIDRKGKILGASILGSHAGELIHEFALAMSANLGIGKISGLVHAYPTLSQVAKRAVNTHYAKKLFSPRVKKILKLLYGYQGE